MGTSDDLIGGTGNNIFVHERDGATDTVFDFGVTYFTATLDSAQANSAGASTASGTAILGLTLDQTQLISDVNLTGLDIDGTQTTMSPSFTFIAARRASTDLLFLAISAPTATPTVN